MKAVSLSHMLICFPQDPMERTNQGEFSLVFIAPVYYSSFACRYQILFINIF